MNRLIQLNKETAVFFVVLWVGCFWLSPLAQAVDPPPDGAYGGANTAEGEALQNLTTGVNNTAIGTGALTKNTTGSNNTANGRDALHENTTGDWNMASGLQALFSNTTGNFNTATGAGALFFNAADENTATGAAALLHNTTGEFNTAAGSAALFSNTTGVHNTANGFQTLSSNTTGHDNVALGFLAGNSQTTGSGNVYIGSNILGVAGENNACYIGSIFGQTSATGIPVLINASNKLGTTTSSKRFKEDIKPMDKASEVVYALKPVTFRYRKELDPQGVQQWGLVAEDVQRLNPDLVALDKEGRPYAVRYDQVNAMLLNEFLKEHQTVQELKKQVAELTAGLQKVSAQLEVSKPAPRTVQNDQ
jgi:hypothetical protein